jgi:hypothetical protein
MDHPGFRVTLLTLIFALLFAPATFASEEPPPQDALKLADEGKIAIDAIAESAYSLKVRVKNLTPDELNVSFPPGLVADTYARFALFQVGGGGGMSSGGGGQSTGLLFSMAVPVEGNGQAALSFQTACLNFGAPEPTPKTVLMIKRVEDFTTDKVFQQLLKDLAANPPEEHVAQAAIWNVVDKLPWKRMKNIRTRRGRFSDESLEEAQGRVGAAQATVSSTGEKLDAEAKKNRLTLPALSVLIHPDPRGRHHDVGLARDAARMLRERWPGVDVSHRNYTPNPIDEETGAVAWCFLVRSVGSAKSPDLQLTPQRNVWNPEKKEWKHESIGSPLTKSPPQNDSPAWLANQLVQHIASRSLVVEKKDDGLLVRSEAPVGLTDVFVTTNSPREQAIKLLGLSLAPGEAKNVKVPLDHQARYSAAKRITATGFTPMIAKAPGD